MLHLSYILHEHGSATASVGSGDRKLDIIGVSFLSDALGDMARSARSTLRGMSESTFSFQMEPGEYRFVVSRDGTQVVVRVYHFAESFSRRQHGELVLTAECSLREFATECINCLRRVLDEHGQAGYRERWKNADFPLREYRDLLELRRELSAVRPAN
jgi:hypothetical protein